MKIAITGHRPNKLGNDYNLMSPLIQRIEKEINIIVDGFLKMDTVSFVDGLALGIDTLFAKIAVYRNIPLIAAIPFFGQEIMWPKPSRDLYWFLVDYARKNGEVVYVSEPGYSAAKMQKRNEWMVDNCTWIIEVWDGSEGGTANCARYAALKKRNCIRINPKTMEITKIEYPSK